MELFEYEPLDLTDYTFRLIHLLGGEGEPIRCNLFNAWLHTDDAIEYEALSYTWGSSDKPFEIETNDKRMPVTENLYLALRYLRHRKRDRIIWVDAICINQNNIKERGHQVRQMASIYKSAERVVIWLGQTTSETEWIFRCMHQLEEDVLRHTYKNMEVIRRRWGLWSSKEQQQIYKGLEILLKHPWFKRVWVIQEVALARSAVILCGVESVSTGVFAMTPSLVGLAPDPHCQALLAIMPGPTRGRSWNSQDLRTLLLSFKGSESTDPRDKIYALLGLSDAHDSDVLVPDYGKSDEEIVHDTMSFILHAQEKKIGPLHLPQWTLLEFLQKLESLGDTVLSWAAENGHDVTVKLLLETNKVDINVNLEVQNGQTPLSLSANNGHVDVAKLLLETGSVNVDPEDRSGCTPFSLAVQHGHIAVVKLLLKTRMVDLDLRDKKGRTPLYWAVDCGNIEMVKLLLETKMVNVDLKVAKRQPSLSMMAMYKDETVRKLLVDMEMTDFRHAHQHGRVLPPWVEEKELKVSIKLLLSNLNDVDGQILLSRIVQYGQHATIKLLHGTKQTNLGSNNQNMEMLLLRASRYGYEGVVELLLKWGKVNVNSEDRNKRTPLLWAAWYGHESVVRLLLNLPNVDVSVTDRHRRTSLSLAAQYGHDAVLKLLITVGERGRKLGRHDWRSMLWSAIEGDHLATVRVLLDTGNVGANSSRGRQTPLEYATRKGKNALAALLKSYIP